MTTQLAETIEQDLNDEIAAVETHPVFEDLESLHDIRRFLESHVFAVFDFMELLEAFHSSDNPTQPWMQSVGYEFADDFVHRLRYPELAHGKPETHFDEYREAMSHLGSEMKGICVFLDMIKYGRSAEDALDVADVPSESRQHVQTTLEIAETNNPTRIAGAILARRDIIPDGFSADLQRVTENIPENATVMPDCFAAFDQPMEFDYEQHANRVLRDARIESNESGRSALIDSAEQMLDARMTLLDGIHDRIR